MEYSHLSKMYAKAHMIENESYSESLPLYNALSNKIQSIRHDHITTFLYEHRLDSISKRISQIKILSAAEQSPIKCSLLLSNAISSPDDQFQVRIKIAESYAKANLEVDSLTAIKAAELSIDRSNNPPNDFEMLLHKVDQAKAYISLGNKYIDNSKEVLADIEKGLYDIKPYVKARILAELAQCNFDLGNYYEAEREAETAKRIYIDEKEKEEETDRREEEYRDKYRLPQKSESERGASLMVRFAISAGSGSAIDNAYIKILTDRHKDDDLSLYLSIQSFDYPPNGILMLNNLANYHIEKNNNEKARKVIDEIYSNIYKINFGLDELHWKIKTSYKYYTIGDLNKAREILADVVNTLEKISDSEYQYCDAIKVKIDLVETYISMNEHEKATTMQNECYYGLVKRGDCGFSDKVIKNYKRLGNDSKAIELLNNRTEKYNRIKGVVSEFDAKQLIQLASGYLMVNDQLNYHRCLNKVLAEAVNKRDGISSDKLYFTCSSLIDIYNVITEASNNLDPEGTQILHDIIYKYDKNNALFDNL